MGVVTSIAMATVAVGGAVYKGVQAGNASTVAAREAGTLRLQQAELEKEAIARLDQDFYEAVRVNTDIYDKALEVSNVKGAELVQAAQEGDQRGIAATAGKVKEIEQAGLGALSDKFSQDKTNIDLARAKAQELSAAEIAAMQDDRAAAAGVRADALMAQSDKLRADSTANYVTAGTQAIMQGVGIAGEISGAKAQGAIEKLVSGGMSIVDAQTTVAGQSKKNTRLFNRGDMDIEAFTGTKAKVNNTSLNQGQEVVDEIDPSLSYDDWLVEYNKRGLQGVQEDLIVAEAGGSSFYNPFLKDYDGNMSSLLSGLGKIDYAALGFSNRMNAIYDRFPK
jgi:hypothetical protein|tara:strand:- start:3976 stop:4983 length:1008 start_codon:yes stop_codon:yes gene_type:complete